MGLSLQEMVEAWREAPRDEAATVGLCERLADGGSPELLNEVGQSAGKFHASSANVLIAVGRMYMGAERLGEAQVVLVAAGRAAPQSGEVFRCLGEVLLRRGDADRAGKALARAAAMGMNDEVTRLWQERARRYLSLQASSGNRTVAFELRRELIAESAAPAGRAPADTLTTEIHTEVVRPSAPSTPGAGGTRPPVEEQPAAAPHEFVEPAARASASLLSDPRAANTALHARTQASASQEWSLPSDDGPAVAFDDYGDDDEVTRVADTKGQKEQGLPSHSPSTPARPSAPQGAGSITKPTAPRATTPATADRRPPPPPAAGTPAGPIGDPPVAAAASASKRPPAPAASASKRPPAPAASASKRPPPAPPSASKRPVASPAAPAPPPPSGRSLAFSAPVSPTGAAPSSRLPTARTSSRASPTAAEPPASLPMGAASSRLPSAAASPRLPSTAASSPLPTATASSPLRTPPGPSWPTTTPLPSGYAPRTDSESLPALSVPTLFDEPEDEATAVHLSVDTAAFGARPQPILSPPTSTGLGAPPPLPATPPSPTAPPLPATPPSHVSPFDPTLLARSGFVAPGTPGRPIEAPVVEAPHTQVLLAALAETGVFDGSRGGAEWHPAPRARTRMLIPLLVFVVVALGALAGGVRYRAYKRKPALLEALALESELDALLQSGQSGSVLEPKFARAFDLTPDSQQLWLLWTRDRTLRAIEGGDSVTGIDGAVDRARKEGVPEARLAFARIGSYLASHDTVDALLTVSAWDARAGEDPYFELLAGAALDRAGDVRCIERYEHATKLAPDLTTARLLLTRAVILHGDLARAQDLVREFRSKWPNRPDVGALAALLWASDPNRRSLPPEYESAKQRRDELSPTLASAIGIAGALDAIQRHRLTDARSALSSAISAAHVPTLSAFVGSVALELGDEELARKAVAASIADSPLYTPGRLLMARIALAQGRYDEADRSVADLAPSLPSVALIRAILAYERLDQPALVGALEALPLDVRTGAHVLPIRHALEVLRGAIDRAESVRLESRENPWGSLLAVDAALDAGDFKTATAFLEAAHDTRPPRALRWARLLRLTGKAGQADAPSKLAFEALGTRRAAIERILVLLANDRVEEARGFATKNSEVLGPLAPWALAYVNADGPHAREARARILSFELPDVDTPLAQRTLVLLALCDAGDRARALVVMRAIARFVPKNPELLAAARSL